MCNFIIRPIKCYATVDITSTKDISESANDIKQGDELTVKEVHNGYVVLVRKNDTVVNVSMETYIHTFSDKDPNAKKENKSK